MIFQYTFTTVLKGQKTQTRRLMKEGDVAVQDDLNQIQAVHGHGREKWRVGKTYAVQTGRGHKAIASIRLKAIDAQKASDISKQEAMKEGYQTREEFLESWKMIHGEANLAAQVWVLTFELVDAVDEKST